MLRAINWPPRRRRQRRQRRGRGRRVQEKTAASAGTAGRACTRRTARGPRPLPAVRDSAIGRATLSRRSSAPATHPGGQRPTPATAFRVPPHRGAPGTVTVAWRASAKRSRRARMPTTRPPLPPPPHACRPSRHPLSRRASRPRALCSAAVSFYVAVCIKCTLMTYPPLPSPPPITATTIWTVNVARPERDSPRRVHSYDSRTRASDGCHFRRVSSVSFLHSIHTRNAYAFRHTERSDTKRLGL